VAAARQRDVGSGGGGSSAPARRRPVVISSEGVARGDVHRSRRCALAADTTPTATPTTSFSELNLIYYYYLFIYYYVNCDVTLPPPPQHPGCCNRAATVALCTTATLYATATAADTAAAKLPTTSEGRYVALPPPLRLRCRAAANAADAAVGIDLIRDVMTSFSLLKWL
jgi:hypothetical protein